MSIFAVRIADVISQAVKLEEEVDMNNHVKKLIAGSLVIFMLITTTSLLAAPPISEPLDVVVVNESADPVPVTVENIAPIPFSASGEWESAGLSGMPPMIAHDLIFFYDVDNTTNPPNTCRFTIHYVTGQFSSRVLHRVELEHNESVEFHYQAGIDTEDLRFGTITPGDGTGNCVRNWAVFGYELP